MTVSTLSFAEIDDAWGRGFGKKPKVKKGRRGDPMCQLYEKKATVDNEAIDGIMEEFLRDNAPVTKGAAQLNHTVLPSDEGGDIEEDPVMPIAETTKKMISMNDLSKGGEMLDVIVFIFSGVILIFMCENILELGKMMR
jgi:hypothetical protein